MRGLLVGLLVLPALIAPASAQEANVRETRCWVGGVAFSAGAGIAGGGGIAECQAATGWQLGKTDALVVGCLLDGKLSSIGAVLDIRDHDNRILKCESSGRWTMIELPADS